MAWQINETFIEDRITGGSQTSLEGADNVKMGLYTSATSPSGNNLVTSLTEVSGTGYTAGGISAGTCTVSEAAGTVTFDSPATFLWSENAAGFSNARYAVLYIVATNQIIAYEDMTTDQNNTTHDFEVVIDAAGIFTAA